MKPIPLILIAVAIVIIAPFIYLPLVDTGGKPAQEGSLPWQIETHADGSSRALGFTLGHSTLAEARARYGDELDVAIITPKDGEPALEAYVASASAGFITGRLVIRMRVPAEELSAMLARASRTEYMESTTRKSILHPDDLATANARAIHSLAFIPTADLEVDTVIQRFGEPAERIQPDPQRQHLLYPGQGLGITVDSRGKEVLQYVAPRDFDPLRAALR